MSSVSPHPPLLSLRRHIPPSWELDRVRLLVVVIPASPALNLVVPIFPHHQSQHADLLLLLLLTPSFNLFFLLVIAVVVIDPGASPSDGDDVPASPEVPEPPPVVAVVSVVADRAGPVAVATAIQRR